MVVVVGGQVVGCDGGFVPDLVVLVVEIGFGCFGGGDGCEGGG